eukprot:688822-Prymnesium_polylepis.1
MLLLTWHSTALRVIRIAHTRRHSGTPLTREPFAYCVPFRILRSTLANSLVACAMGLHRSSKAQPCRSSQRRPSQGAPIDAEAVWNSCPSFQASFASGVSDLEQRSGLTCPRPSR